MQHLAPSFFIIGERKCATSSLYRYLIDHPQILPCRIKEPQFFSHPWWYRTFFAARYRAMFPKIDAHEMHMQWYDLDDDGNLIRENLVIRCDPNKRIITGEASANTFAQVPPIRISRAYPDAKLILCLRHPVDRAYSHYRMLRRFAQEGRRIPFRPTDFLSDFKIDLARLESGGQGYFTGISFYTDRLMKWTEVFGKDNIKIIRTEDLMQRNTAQTVLSDLCGFLGIENFDFSDVLQIMVNTTKTDNLLDPQVRKTLWTHYADDVHALEEYTGRKFYWNS